MQKEKGRIANGTTQLEQCQHITKYELVVTHLLEQGFQGVSVLSGLVGLSLSRPRMQPSLSPPKRLEN
ncbi:hypothetical protein [Aeromonas enteropelogenes]|uniref:hypothetical protein n=1 Tax=Aeromonas enteropelogenes TaxID=29489 RepID=UPI001CE374AE|nr:hypothetical protein [Aeromonas enteropelogenes]MCZ0753776.1 hypothetical protein [Aeromonas enteropelogenes]UCA09430.1 hypothetical protein LA364_12035 [Aeromonas enteropelogenes]